MLVAKIASSTLSVASWQKAIAPTLNFNLTEKFHPQNAKVKARNPNLENLSAK